MKFSDIPKVTGDGLYNVNVEWRDLLETLEHYQDSRDGLCVLDLDPDFQRGYVWTEAQQIAYVEYRLKGGGAGVNRILFNCVGHMGSYLGPFQIVDGKQRLNSAMRFLKNEIPAFGYYYVEYEDRLRNVDFIFNINKLETRKEVLQWYLDLNTGGTVHTSSEIEKVKRLIAEEKELEYKK